MRGREAQHRTPHINLALNLALNLAAEHVTYVSFCVCELCTGGRSFVEGPWGASAVGHDVGDGCGRCYESTLDLCEHLRRM